MASFGEPVAQEVNVNPQQGLQTLSGLLGLKQQQLALQTGQYQKESAAAEAATKGVAAKGQTEAADFLKNFDFAQHIGPDGTVDLDAVYNSPNFQKAGPGKDLIANTMLGIKKGQIQNKQEMATLNGSVITGAGKLLGSLVSDPDVVAGNDKGKAKIQSQIDIIKEMYPDQGATFVDKFEKGLNSDHVKPKDWQWGLRAMQLQAEDVASQQAQQNPVLGTATGPNSNIVGTAQNRVTGDIQTASGGVPQGISPAQYAQTIQLPNGQVTTLGAFLGRGAGGGAVPAGGAPGAPAAPQGASPFLKPNGVPRTAADDAPPPNAPAQIQSQFAAAAKGTSDYVEQVRAADEQYGTNVAVNNAIRHLLKDTKTGPGTKQWHDILGALGAPAGVDNVSDYQQLGAWLDRQAAGMRTAMGLPATNQGQATSETISGSTQYQPSAIAAKNNFNQALVEGLHQQRQGLDRVAGFSGNPSPNAVRAFQSAWANNFDPIIHEYKAAKRRGDTEGVKAILATLTPQQAKELAGKGRNLDRLERAQAPQ